MSYPQLGPDEGKRIYIFKYEDGLPPWSDARRLHQNSLLKK